MLFFKISWYHKSNNAFRKYEYLSGVREYSKFPGSWSKGSRQGINWRYLKLLFLKKLYIFIICLATKEFTTVRILNLPIYCGLRHHYSIEGTRPLASILIESRIFCSVKRFQPEIYFAQGTWPIHHLLIIR